jgi:hypothetical protein
VKPSITHTHGFLDDCNDVTGWTETESGLVASISTSSDDYFTITGTCDNAADEYAYYEKDITNVSTILYPYLLVRWKTSAIANGLQAKIGVTYTGAGLVTTTLGFSAGWKTTVITLTASDTIDKIRIYADDDPDTIAAGTFYVYYDFIMVCGLFTFPNCAGGLHFTAPSRYGLTEIPPRIADVSQYLGAESATVDCSCNLDIGNWKRSTDSVNGDVFLDIAHNSYKEPFQWLDTGTERFKVTLDRPVFRREVNGSKTSHMLDLTFKEFRRCNGNLEYFRERFHSEGQL